MSRIACKTLRGASPQGRGRIWFCATPEDYALYFEGVSNELLSAAKCAVYYDTTPELPFGEGELAEALSEINLFAIPITSRFLLTENRARCEELAYATEHHIPILPLMQEAGLDADFNRVIGDLQYLDKSVTDVTAIPYAEKLSRFLSSVLVGDEQAAEVRAAFDAYVFLSYRKKDRRYAQELMRLIHRCDFCRDVAIWYDEFLTPGENFNRAIAGALKRCDLFALAVTPNLVVEENYVRSTEYPAARKAGKRILAAELLPTDRAALQEGYEGIPDPIDPHGDAALTEALRTALSDISLRRHEGDPRQDFLIGLAYLSGIDVEVDRERAVGLITGAGEAGLAKAMVKLVSMYRAGEGVPRDHGRAIAWQKRLVDRYTELYREAPSEEAAHRVTNEHGNLYDMLYDGRRYREAVEGTNALLAFLSEGEGYPFYPAARAQALRRIGNIALSEGHFGKAEKQYRLALAETERIPEREGSTQKQESYLQTYIKLGDLARERRDYAKAREYFERALALLSPAKREGRSRSLLHGRLGTVALKLGEHDEAQKHYDAALAIDLRTLRDTGTALAKRDLSVSYDRLGNLARDRMRLKKAYEYYTEALALDREYYEDTGTVAGGRALSLSLLRVGSVAFDLADLADAETHFLEALALRREFLAAAPTLEAQRDLVAALSWMGRVAVKRGEFKKAEAYFTEELDLNLDLASRTPIPEVIRDVGISCQRFASVAKSLGHYREAMIYLEKSLMIDEMLLSFSRTVEAMRDVSVSYDSICSLAWKMKDYDRAMTYAEKECALDRELLAITGSPSAKSDLATACLRLGDICLQVNKHEEAAVHYGEAVALTLEVYAQIPNTRTRRELAVAYWNRGIAANRLEDHEEAVECYRRAAALFGEVFLERKSGGNSLIDSLHKLAEAHLSLGDAEAALRVYRAAYPYCLQMREIEDTPEAQGFAARTQEHIARTALRLGDREAARTAFAETATILTALVAAHPELAYYTKLLYIVKRELADLK